MNLRSDADAISRLICNMTNSSATKQMFLMLSLTTTVAIIFFLAAAAAGVDAAASPSAASRPSYTGETDTEMLKYRKTLRCSRCLAATYIIE